MAARGACARRPASRIRAVQYRSMSEIDRPANAKPVTESVLPEIRRPRLLRLSPDMLREMAERTKRTKELDGSGRQSLRQPDDGAAALKD